MRKYVLKKGDRFNFLTVIKYHSREKGYLCICDCGKQTIVKTWSLKNGKTKSCGCKREYFRAKKTLLNNFKGIKSNLYNNYKNAAKRRNYTFELTKTYFNKLITQNCYYCGQKPNMVYKYGGKLSEVDYTKFKYNGIDRIDNTKGYTIKNCVACCKICNNSKASLTKKEWFKWLLQIYNYNFK